MAWPISRFHSERRRGRQMDGRNRAGAAADTGHAAELMKAAALHEAHLPFAPGTKSSEEIGANGWLAPESPASVSSVAYPITSAWDCCVRRASQGEIQS